MSVRAFVAVVAALVALVGLVALALPVHAQGTYSCGIGYAGKEMAWQNIMRAGIEQDCADALATRRAWTWPLVGIGLVGLVGAAVVRRRITESQPQSPSD